MNSSATALTYAASAAVNPKRIVKVSGNRTVAQCSADTDVILGVSGRDESAYNETTHAAAAGDPCVVYVPDGREVIITAGGTVSAGGYVTADSDGKAIDATTDDVTDSETGTTAYAIGPVIQGGASGEDLVVINNVISVRKVSA